MIVHKGANKALLCLILYFAYFFKEYVVRWDVGPCRVLEGLRTSVVVHMFLKLPDGIFRFLNVSLYEAVAKNFFFLLF